VPSGVDVREDDKLVLIGDASRSPEEDDDDVIEGSEISLLGGFLSFLGNELLLEDEFREVVVVVVVVEEGDSDVVGTDGGGGGTDEDDDDGGCCCGDVDRGGVPSLKLVGNASLFITWG